MKCFLSYDRETMTRNLRTVKTFFKNLSAKDSIDTPHQTDTIPETAARKMKVVDKVDEL
jgi:hypothetical protein